MSNPVDVPDVTGDLYLVERFIEVVPVPVTVLDIDGTSVLANRAYCDALGLERSAVTGRPTHAALHPDDLELAESVLASALASGTGSAHLRLRHDDGRFLTFHWDLLFDDAIGWIIGIASDRTSELERLADAQHRARTDALTGLLSRSGLMEELEQMCNSERDNGVVVALFDVDGFKGINDHLGHQVGDSVLRSVARRVRKSVPDGATIGRLGGDEFVVFCPRSVASGVSLAIAVESAFEVPFELAGRHVAVGASIGVRESSGPESVDDLLRNADIAVYEAKHRGGSCSCVATETLIAAWDSLRRIEQDLAAALGVGEFVPHFQPIVDVVSGRTVVQEVLLRWVKPDGSLQPADSFLEVAESSGLLNQISTEVREIAIEMAGREPSLDVALNVSAGELLDEHFGIELVSLVRRRGVDPERVVIEVTEQTALRDLDRAASILGRLRAIGFRIALDDFGSGFSSLTYLTQLPIDIVKLDRHFVRAAAASQRGLQVFTAMTEFLKQVDLIVVVEGVEDEDDHALVCELGIDMAQGWFYGHPAPLEHWTNSS